MLNEKGLGPSAPFGAKKGGNQLQAENIIGAVIFFLLEMVYYRLHIILHDLPDIYKLVLFPLYYCSLGFGSIHTTQMATHSGSESGGGGGGGVNF